MGYDMSWASFAVVEIMSSPRFAHKRIGYLAACQTFTDTTDVVLLTTNLLKKEFQSPNQYEVGLAVNCLANIVTRDLARDLIGDIVGLIGHSKPYVRKKAVLSLYKLYIKYPQGLRLTFERLKEKLEDPESAVVSCAVNVICELAHKNPTNYLALAPKFFRLLTTSSNNWMLIKVVKLLGSLVSEEPRLARKLLEPLATIIQNTAAKSLLYECIHTVTLALPYARKPGDQSNTEGGRNLQAVVALCADHLRQFVEDPDQNLKYLGLVGFVDLMKSFPRTVVEHKELVLQCLSDDDVTIRMRALELLTGMVTRRNLTELVHKLMQHVLLAEGPYRDEIIQKILFMCSRDKYAYLSDIPWYVSVLVDLAYVQGPVHGPLVAAQLIDVAVRAEAVRGYAVKCMLGLLRDSSELFLGQSQATMAHVLYAAGWIIGEYADKLPRQGGGGDEDEDEDEEGQEEGFPAASAAAAAGTAKVFAQVLAAYLDPKVTNLPEDVQVVYMQNALKVLAVATRHVSDDDELEGLLMILRVRLPFFLQSVHIEVQERATTLKNLLTCLGVLPKQPGGGGEGEGEGKEEAGERCERGLKKRGMQDGKGQAVNLLGMDLMGNEDDTNADGSTTKQDGASSFMNLNNSNSSSSINSVRAIRLCQALLSALFAEQLQPVNPKAQKKVPVPEGLDLSSPLDPSGLSELEAYTGGFPCDPDLARVTFTHVFVAPEPVIEERGKEGGRDEMEAAFGSPRRLPRGGREGGGIYVEASSPGYQPGDVSRQKWQTTPFYLTSTSVAAGDGENGGESEVTPPSFHLTAADLEGRGRRQRGEGGREEGRKGRRKSGMKGGHRRGQPSGSSDSISGGAVLVLRDEVMPEGAVDSDSEKGGGKNGKRGGRKGHEEGEEEEEEEKMDLKDVDITKPLRPHEFMPRMEHRVPAAAATPTPPPAKEKKGKKKMKEGDRRKRGDKGGKAAAGASSRRHHKEEKESKSSAAAAADSASPLIDLRDFEAGNDSPPSLFSSSSISSFAKPRNESKNALRLKADAMDLLQFGNSSPLHPPTTTAGGEAAATASFLRGEERGEEGGRVLGRGGGEKVTEQRRKEKGSGSSRRSSGKKNSKREESLLDLNGGGGEGGEGNGGAAGPSSFSRLRFPLIKVAGLRIDYSLALDVDHHQLTVHFRVKYPSTSSSSSAISDLRLYLRPLPPGFTSPLSIGGLSIGGGAGVMISKIAPGETAKAFLKLRFPLQVPPSTLTMPFEMDHTGGKEGRGGGDLLVPTSPARAKKERGELVLPACAFLCPGHLSPSGFMSLLSLGQVQWQEATVRLPLRSRSSGSKKRGGAEGFDAVVAHLATFFQSQIVETTPPAAAALYSTVVGGKEGGQEHHVALLAKFVDGGEMVEIALKSDMPGLAGVLAAEAKALCTF